MASAYICSYIVFPLTLFYTGTMQGFKTGWKKTKTELRFISKKEEEKDFLQMCGWLLR